MNNLEQTEKPNNRPVITGIIILLILTSLTYLAIKISVRYKQEQTVTISETDTEESDPNVKENDQTSLSSDNTTSSKKTKPSAEEAAYAIKLIRESQKRLKQADKSDITANQNNSNSTEPSTSTDLSEKEEKKRIEILLKNSLNYTKKTAESNNVSGTQNGSAHLWNGGELKSIYEAPEGK